MFSVVDANFFIDWRKRVILFWLFLLVRSRDQKGGPTSSLRHGWIGIGAWPGKNEHNSWNLEFLWPIMDKGSFIFSLFFINPQKLVWGFGPLVEFNLKSASWLSIYKKISYVWSLHLNFQLFYFSGYGRHQVGRRWHKRRSARRRRSSRRLNKS